MANDRSRRRVFPASSIMLEKRWQDQRYEQHQNKLREMRGSVDQSPPEEYPHLKYRAKQEQMKKEREAEISQENQLLLKRLQNIFNGHGQIDNWNHYKHHSLNEMQRENERREEEENATSLRKHVAAVRQYYSVEQWEKDFERHRQYLTQMSQTTKPYQMNSRKSKSSWRGTCNSDDMGSTSISTDKHCNISNSMTSNAPDNDVNNTSHGHVDTATPTTANDNA